MRHRPGPARNDNSRARRRVISADDFGSEVDLQRAVKEATDQIEDPVDRAEAYRTLSGFRARMAGRRQAPAT